GGPRPGRGFDLRRKRELLRPRRAKRGVGSYRRRRVCLDEEGADPRAKCPDCVRESVANLLSRANVCSGDSSERNCASFGQCGRDGTHWTLLCRWRMCSNWTPLCFTGWCLSRSKLPIG